MIIVAACGTIPVWAGEGAAGAEVEFTPLLDTYLAKFKPLFLEAQAASWEANVSGTDQAFARKQAAETAVVKLHSDPQVFGQLKALKEGGKVTDPALRRQVEVMYRSYLRSQGDPQLHERIVALENELDQIFNTHRSRVAGKDLTENDVREILGSTRDSAAAAATWKAYMEVGAKADAKLRELVALRNTLARQLGFANYYVLSLTMQEMEEAELLAMFDELDVLTRQPFAELKQRIDGERAAHFGIPAGQLRPWHFGDLFFQEAPPTGELDADALFARANLVELAKAYYAGIGLPCEDILVRSDLYEKPGKCPHAFCAHLDRAGDIRVLCNLKPNAYWADTLLHELGHAVYDKYLDPQAPFLLRSAAHGLTTEGIAVMFGALSMNESWLRDTLQVEPTTAHEVAGAMRARLRTERLIFSRWAQVMVRFEHGMYANPEQDLGKLWWDLKRQYQLLNPPESVQRPDYAAKTHVLGTPAYYHNYLLGELFAAQVRHQLASKVLGVTDPRRIDWCNDPRIGEYLRTRVFAPGALYSWRELTQRATGEPLGPRCFVAELEP